jgi:hypothetical protein
LSTSSSFTTQVYTVTEITDDAWNYGIPMSQGTVSVGRGSPITTGLQVDTKSGFLLETGPVIDQSFAGGASSGVPTLYIGGGDYSTLFDSTAANTISLTPDETDNSFGIDYVGFGQLALDGTTGEPTTGFFQGLGYEN